MAKDKQLFDGDKAISFQRAVFIVCNLKRLIKRPKKEEKQAAGEGGHRRRSGASNEQATGELGAESSSGLRRNRRGRGGSLKEPVRRAFTLPSMLCGTLGGASGAQLHSLLNRDDQEEGNQEAPQVHLRQPEPLSMGPAPLNTNNNCSVSCLATPVRGRQRADDGQRSPRQIRHPDPGRRATTFLERQTVCPVWAHVMGQLDRRQRPPLPGADQEQGQAPSPLPYLVGRHEPADNVKDDDGDYNDNHDDNDDDDDDNDNVSWPPADGCDASQDSANEQQRRSSNGDTEKATWLRPATAAQLGHSSCDRQSIASGHSTSPSSDVGPYAASSLLAHHSPRKRHQPTTSRCPEVEQQVGAGSRLLAAEGQPMKRFSSALCLADEPGQHQYLLEATTERKSASNKLARAKPAQKRSPRARLAPVERPEALAEQRRPSAGSQAAAAANLDQQALFSAVECNQLERAKSILEEGKANVNSLNADKLTCLDVAVLLRNAEMARLLQQHQAKESSAYLAREARQAQLQALYADARRLVEDLSRSLGAMAAQSGAQAGTQVLLADADDKPLMLATGSLLSSALIEEKQRQLQYWKRRLDLFMHMRYEFEQLQVPNAPELIVLQVVGEQSLGVKIVHSLQANSTTTAPSGACDPEQVANLNPNAPGSLRAPPQHLRCLDGASCSHHLHLAELFQSEAAGTRSPQLEFGSDRQQQQKLAVFNQLLQQQLRILSNQQVNQTGEVSTSTSSSSKQQKKLAFLNAQSSSTESACESLQSRQSGPSGSSHLEALEPPASIAYRLMTAGRSAACSKPAAELKGDPSHKDSLAKRRQVVIITKYKVEWALNEHFEPLLGSMVVYNTNQYPIECQIDSLTSGQLHWVRVSSGNHAGFCPAQPSTPACLAPSSWRQVDGQVGRRQHQDQEVFRKFTKLILLNKHILDDHQPMVLGDNQHYQLSSTSGANNKSNLINMLLLDATLPTGSCHQHYQHQHQHQQQSGETVELEQQQASGVSMRKNLKNFFQSNSFKFNKLNNQNKRGLYLTALVYSSPVEQSQQAPGTRRPGNLHELTNSQDKIVVTNDDRLPVIEVANEVVAPAALMSDFYWLLKINGTQWMDIKRLRQQLQKSHSSSTLHLRIKILSAIEQLQSALNMEDIGRLFYRPIQAHDGSIVICTCKRVQNTKLVASLSIKWTQLHKIIPRHLRKISDSMLGAEQHHQQQHQHQKTMQIYGGAQRGGRQSSAAVFHMEQELRDKSPVCDYCQSLSQRRFTMASGSSTSSLATTDSQTSQQSANTGCSCQTPSHQHQRASLMPGSAPGASSGGCGGALQRPVSLSVGGTSGGQSSGTGSRHSSQSSAGQLTAAPQKSSTYLMLASLTLYDLLLFTLNEIIHFHQASQLPLQRGLYLGFLQLQTTVESMRLLVPRARPNMVPCSRVRDNPHVSREEWQLLKRFGSFSTSGGSTSVQKEPSGPTRVEPSPVDILEQPPRSQQRASDPSIWSLPVTEVHQQRLDEKSPVEAVGQPQSDDGHQLSIGGRDRAKSVSPGLIKHLKHQQVSMSSESVQLQTSNSSLAPQVTTTVCAHSDTELSGASEFGLSKSGTPLKETAKRRLKAGRQQQSPSSTSRLTVSSLNAPPSYAVQSAPEETFVRLVGSAARRLLDELRSQLPKVSQGTSHSSILQSLNDDENNRIYHVELIELSNQVTFVLLLPAPENVCPVTSQEKSNILADNKEYMLLPLQIFETIHISTYEPELLGKYSRLSTILETDLIVAQHDHRQAFSSNELKSTKSRVSHLQNMVNIADEFWRKLRWIVDVVSFARDKSNQTVNGGIRLSSIWRYFELASPGAGVFSPSLRNQHHQDTCSSTGSYGIRYNNAGSMTLSVSGQQLHQRRGASRSAVNQQQRQLEEESQVTCGPNLGIRGTGMEVKRTTSAKTSLRSSQRQQHGFVQVPEIHLNRPPQALNSSTATTVVMATTNPRRHSGGESSRPTTDSYQQQANLNDLEETSWLDFRLSTGVDDDDQAIYAYHISLKDATRAAAQRKTSQLSIWPLVVAGGEPTLDSPEVANDNKTESLFPLVSPPPPPRSHLSNNQPTTSKQESFDTVRLLDLDQSPTTGVDEQQHQYQTDTTKLQKKRHLKATNPFLSDSFD